MTRTELRFSSLAVILVSYLAGCAGAQSGSGVFSTSDVGSSHGGLTGGFDNALDSELVAMSHHHHHKGHHSGKQRRNTGGGGGAAAAAPRASNLNWQMQSFHPNQIWVAFYSQNRDAVWPGGGETYFLGDDAVHGFNLGCTEGETICYGAWLGNGQYWGVGQGNQAQCTDCCFICDGSTTGLITFGQ